jgi:hypothetical protein
MDRNERGLHCTRWAPPSPCSRDVAEGLQLTAAPLTRLRRVGPPGGRGAIASYLNDPLQLLRTEHEPHRGVRTARAAACCGWLPRARLAGGPGQLAHVRSCVVAAVRLLVLSVPSRARRAPAHLRRTVARHTLASRALSPLPRYPAPPSAGNVRTMSLRVAVRPRTRPLALARPTRD